MDSKVRWVLDYRHSNAQQEIPKIPLPNIEGLFDRMQGSQYFSKLDLATGYHQMLVEPESRKYTAFQTHSETYEWLVAPMGMASMPGVWSRLMNKLFGKLSFCVVYMDDICICSKTIEEHADQLRQVFLILRREKMYCRREKCSFAMNEVEYLGHVITRDGVTVDPRKISAIEKWPTPTNQKQLQSWLGLCGYYRKFVFGFAEIAYPLGELTKDKIKWYWGPDQERAFQLLKIALQQAPVLTLPDFTRPFIVTTDCSGKCAGAVLAQLDANNDDHPIAFMSKKLNETEQRWPAHEQELYAIKLALGKWRQYLWGQSFSVYTDNSACKWFLQTPQLNAKMARWLDYFSQFEFELFHRPGVENVVADCLSRPPDEVPPPRDVATVSVDATHVDTSQSPSNSFVTAHSCEVGCSCAQVVHHLLRHRRQLDLFLGLTDRDQRILLDNLLGETVGGSDRSASSGDSDQAVPQTIRVNSITNVQFMSVKLDESTKAWYRKAYRNDPAFQKYAKGKAELIDSDGLYFLRSNDQQWKLVVPNDSHLRTEVISQFHDAPTAAHPGTRRTQLAVGQWYFWPGMFEDIELYVRSCQTCARYKSHRGKPSGLLQPLPIPPTCWHSVAIDWITGLPMSNGYDAIMTCTCRLSKRSKYCATHTTTDAPKAAKEFFDTVVRHHGLPEAITSDRDPKFKSMFWNELMRLMGIKHYKTTAHRAQGDGQSEIVNRNCEDSLRCMCSYLGDDWSSHLGTIEYAHSGLTHTSHGMTPFEVDTGRKLRNVLWSDTTPVANEFARNFSAQRQEMISLAQDNLRKAQERQKRYYDKARVEVSCLAGDKVMLATRDLPLRHAQIINVSERPKLVPRWIGPFKVLERVGTNSYRLQLPQSMNQLETNVFNVDRLKIAPPQPREFNTRPVPKATPVVLNEVGEELHTIEAFLRERTFNRKREYLVKWQGFPEHEATWELEKNVNKVVHFKRLVKDLRKRRRQEREAEEAV